MCDVGLAAYRQCTFREKREVLGVFWSRRGTDSDLIGAAAREYGTYALAMVVAIAVELAVIAMVLVARANAWAWPAILATGLAALATWRTRTCQRALTSATSDAPRPLP